MRPLLRPDRIVRELRALDAAAAGPHSGGLDDRALRRRMLDVIGAAPSPTTSTRFVLTDPQTTVGTSPLAEVPDLDDLPRVIRLKYLTRPGRWTTLAESGCTTLLAATGGDLSRSDQWAGALRQHGVTDVLRRRAPGPPRDVGLPRPVAPHRRLRRRRGGGPRRRRCPR